jgi:hypothetical protein
LTVVPHSAYVTFVVVGLLILLGRALGWKWTRNFWFRVIRLATIAIVVVQAWLGIVCPLTRWENVLRQRAGQATYPGSFIGYWAHELICFGFPPWVFTVCYTLFGLAVLATLVFVPPRWLGKVQAIDEPGHDVPV